MRTELTKATILVIMFQLMKRTCFHLGALLCASILAGCGNDPVSRSFTERPPEHTGGPSIFAGKVIDNNAQPLSNVMITARGGTSIVANPETLPIIYQGHTLADGRFNIPRHDSQAIYLTFAKPGYQSDIRWLYLLVKGEDHTPAASVPVTFLSSDVQIVNDTFIILYDLKTMPPTR